MNARYEIVTWPSDSLQVVGGTYVYILCSSFQGRDIPFYVGQAINLQHRFAKHDRINWHYDTLQAPVRIHIAGQVAREHVDVAEQDLIAQMINASFIMTNFQIDDDRARRLNGSKAKLEALPKAEVLAYLASDDTPLFQFEAFQEWALEWHTKPIAGDLIDTDLLRACLLSLDAGFSEDEQEIHGLLTRIYDFQTGCSGYALSNREAGLIGLHRIWSIPLEESERDQAQRKIRLRADAISAARKAAEAVDSQWMNALSGAKKVNLLWAPPRRYEPYLAAKKEADRLQRKLRAMEVSGSSSEEIAAFQAELQPRLEALVTLKYRLDSKYV